MNRKEYPLYEGLFKYFPDALMEVSHVSYIANEQHNPGTPIHWDRNKSPDELDAMLRHTIDTAKGTDLDNDSLLHEAKIAWRALANLQRKIERQKKISL